MKKKLLIILIFIIIILLLWCQKQGNSLQTQNNTLETFTILNDGEFNPAECSQRGLDGLIIMLESEYCGHCKTTLPDFQEACEESGVTPIILDVSITEHRDQMKSYGLEIQYTPTFIFNCKYFVGAKTKEKYLNLIQN